ncbi:heterokaryon incompatibility protein-domain-containing protein [Halenospora varia]|nr:heterokaryon incompatibility protein-domain-containing protein [Halenospora varia]
MNPLSDSSRSVKLRHGGTVTVESYDGALLCNYCEKIRDLDLFLLKALRFRHTSKHEKNSPGSHCEELRLAHHSSWTDLRISAKLGCKLCHAFNTRLLERETRLRTSINWELELFWGCLSTENNVENAHFGVTFYLGYEGCDILSFDIFTQPGDPLSRIIYGRPVAKDSSSDACIDVVWRWLHKCRLNHPACSSNSNHFLPTRVIDVGSGKWNRDPFLFISDGQRGEWATLSHVWGDGVPLQTHLDNIQHWQKKISFKELPQSFQDAIIITRKLGIPYLWIDSLCIIQDCPDDWARESVKMDEIYSNAVMGISASSAANSNRGIFRSGERGRLRAQPFIALPCYTNSKALKGLVEFRIHVDDCGSSMVEDLHKRAWCLQEYILPVRRLEYGSHCVSWSCDTLDCSERLPHSATLVQDTITRATRKLRRIPVVGNGCYPSHPDIEGDQPNSWPMEWWYKVLGEYTRRDITKAEDRLPAISGLAKKIAERTGYTYIAGLWLEDLHRGLLWRSIGTTIEQPLLELPTWTWAAKTHAGFGQQLHDLVRYEPGPRALVLEAGTRNLNDDPFTKVISATLRLRGRCRAVAYWQDPFVPDYEASVNEGSMNDPLDTKNRRGLVCMLDRRAQDASICHRLLVKKHVICMQIAKFYDKTALSKERKKGRSILFGLLLEATGVEDSQYRRIGIAEIPEEEGFAERWEEMDNKLSNMWRDLDLSMKGLGQRMHLLREYVDSVPD